MARPALLSGVLSAIVLLGLCASGAAQATDAPQRDNTAAAQPAPSSDLQDLPEALAADPIDTAGKVKLSLSGLYGFGFNSVDVGVTTYGDDVSISGGGGFGFAGRIGYGISRRFDIDIDLGFQVSTLMPAVSNADGTFARSYLLATLKYKVPTSDTGQFKFGLGAGSYFGGELDVDTAGVTGGSHTIVTYEPAVGLHVTGEFERFIRPDVSFHLGAKIYVVKYDADGVTYNGISGPVVFLADDVREFDGSGFDIMIGISKYF